MGRLKSESVPRGRLSGLPAFAPVAFDTDGSAPGARVSAARARSPPVTTKAISAANNIRAQSSHRPDRGSDPWDDAARGCAAIMARLSPQEPPPGWFPPATVETRSGRLFREQLLELACLIHLLQDVA